LVVACDSVGGIGPKPGDFVTETGYTVGYFALRVPLLELLAAGATPRLIVNNLCFENGEVAKEMIRAMVEVAAEVGLAASAVTGSTEENVPTSMTAIGVSVIGSSAPGELRTGASRTGDLLACVGLPRSAPAHRLATAGREMPSIAEVVAVLKLPGVHEVLPIGSSGLLHEIAALAATAALRYQIRERHTLQDSGIDVHASGGPASCVLVSLAPPALDSLRALRADLPVAVVGELF